jgi:hypothetical protein
MLAAQSSRAVGRDGRNDAEGENEMALPVGINNHIEMVYRPGERGLAKRVFELVGREVVDDGRPWLKVDGRLFISEVKPKQWEFELQLAELIEQRKHDPALEPFLQNLKTAPQYYSHFGIGIATEAEWERLLDRVREAGASDAELKGRIEVASVFRPGDPGAIGQDSVQAFLRTDVFAAGLLTLGQTFELNHYYENDKTRAQAA